MPKMSAAAYIAALPSVLRQRSKEECFQVYMADSIQAIVENTAVSASYLSDGKAGKLIGTRLADIWAQAGPRKPEPAEELSPDEVIENIRQKIVALPPG